MAVSVRLEPLLEKELELAAKRLGVTKSQFIVSALERALGRQDPYALWLKLQAEVQDSAPEVPQERVSPARAAIRSKLQTRHEASRADWLAFQEARKQGKAWVPPDSARPAS
jgi:RHH-type rel operon transcriptional repressor/antitoxin RelB